MTAATIASVSREFDEQPSLLRDFQGTKSWSELEEASEPIVVGAGDSYAAALCASYLAGPSVLALDPYSLEQSIGWATGREVFLVSISGETTSNIELARSLRGTAKLTTAITSSPQSRLAKEVDRVLPLPFKPVAKSPGFATFTLSLAAVLKVCGVAVDVDFRDAFSRGAAAKKIKLARGGGVTHYVANNELYAASIYGVAKLYELLGSRAQATLLEEFSHMPLFSLSTSDTVNVVETPDGRKGELLHEKLAASGFSSSLIRLQGGPVGRLYELVFAVQGAALKGAKARGLKAPYFLSAKKKLKISDEMIY